MDVAHNAINIAEELGIILKEWKIEHKVVAVTTDNAKSVVNATSRLNIMHIPCLGHTLQLGVKKALELSQVQARVRRIVRYVHKSTKATYQLREKQNMLRIQQSTLKNDCLTRWGSTYEMLLSVKQQEQSVCAVLLETTRRDLMLSSCDLALVEELLLVLKPFNDATEIVGGEKYPTISIIAPLLHKFINIILKEEENDSPITKEVKEAIRTDLTTRYQSDEIQVMLNMAMFLDPRFKSLKEQRKQLFCHI